MLGGACGGGGLPEVEVEEEEAQGRVKGLLVQRGVLVEWWECLLMMMSS